MAIVRKEKERKQAGTALPSSARSTVYRGKRTQAGNSQALRFDHALFKSHPEFSGEVEAHVLAPGRMLVVAKNQGPHAKEAEDPVVASFLSFLAADLQRSPHHIQPLDAKLMARIAKLTRGVAVNPDEPLEDEATL